MIKETLYPLQYFIKNYPARALMVIIALLVSGVSEGVSIVALMPLLQLVIQGNILGESSVNNFFQTLFGHLNLEVTLLTTLVFLILFITIKAVTKLFAMYIVSISAAKITEDLRLRLTEAIWRANWSYFASKPSGHISTAISNEPNLAASCIVKTCNFISETIQITVYLFIAFCLSWWVSLGAIMLAILGTLILSSVFKNTIRAGQNQTDYQKTLLANIIDSIKIMKPIRAMGGESYFKPFILTSIKNLKKAHAWILFSPHVVEQSNEIIKVLSLSISLYVLIGLWEGGVDALFILAILFVRILQKLNVLQKTFTLILSQVPSFIYTLKTISEAESNREKFNGTKSPTFNTNITFQNVNYNFNTKDVLKDASFKIKKNNFTLITGPSGKGKSTLVDLICGLYEIHSGHIFIDGQDIQATNMKNWRKKIGYVPQDPILFNDTIKNNITLYDNAIEDNEVLKVLQAVGAADFIEAQPNGIQTLVGESGSKLSGGQKQRILLARALIRSPNLLILDEASAGLDEDTEHSIFENLRSLTNKLTIIAITHNENLKKYADEVFVLDQYTLRLAK